MVLLTKGGAYLTSKTVKDGDVVKFLDEGQWEQNTKFLRPDGSPSNQFNITVEHNGETKKVKITRPSQDSLGDAWSLDTKKWIMKSAVISLVPTPTGKMSIWLKPVKTMNAEDIEFKN